MDTQLRSMKVIEMNDTRRVYEITNPGGTARLTSYPVYPGIDINYVEAHIQSFSCYTPLVPLPGVFAINHCEAGRIECSFRNGQYLYMGPGDMSVSWRSNKEYCHSAYFPAAHYHGLSIVFRTSLCQPVMDTILGDDQIDLTALCNRFCTEKDFGMILRENQDFRRLFTELYHVPETIQKRYFQLKVQEILLFLTTVPVRSHRSQHSISQAQVDTIKAVHADLIQHLQLHPTIEELAAQYALAPTTLKRCFKEIYGNSIKQYMKDFRVAWAKRELARTERSIKEIATDAGYENSSKFSQVFQSATGMAPREYRQRYEKIIIK